MLPLHKIKNHLSRILSSNTSSQRYLSISFSVYLFPSYFQPYHKFPLPTYHQSIQHTWPYHLNWASSMHLYKNVFKPNLSHSFFQPSDLLILIILYRLSISTATIIFHIQAYENYSFKSTYYELEKALHLASLL